MRSCCSTITVGHEAMGGLQESRWDGIPDHDWVHTLYGSFLRSRVFDFVVLVRDAVRLVSVCGQPKLDWGDLWVR